MKIRSLVGLAVVVTMAVLVTTVPLASQAGSTASGPAPRTSSGEPDLQGIWTYESQIPLQRPAKTKVDRVVIANEADVVPIKNLNPHRAAEDQSLDKPVDGVGDSLGLGLASLSAKRIGHRARLIDEEQEERRTCAVDRFRIGAHHDTNLKGGGE